MRKKRRTHQGCRKVVAWLAAGSTPPIRLLMTRILPTRPLPALPPECGSWWGRRCCPPAQDDPPPVRPVSPPRSTGRPPPARPRVPPRASCGRKKNRTAAMMALSVTVCMSLTNSRIRGKVCWPRDGVRVPSAMVGGLSTRCSTPVRKERVASSASFRFDADHPAARHHAASRPRPIR